MNRGKSKAKAVVARVCSKATTRGTPAVADHDEVRTGTSEATSGVEATQLGRLVGVVEHKCKGMAETSSTYRETRQPLRHLYKHIECMEEKTQGSSRRPMAMPCGCWEVDGDAGDGGSGPGGGGAEGRPAEGGDSVEGGAPRRRQGWRLHGRTAAEPSGPARAGAATERIRRARRLGGGLVEADLGEAKGGAGATAASPDRGGRRRSTKGRRRHQAEEGRRGGEAPGRRTGWRWPTAPW